MIRCDESRLAPSLKEAMEPWFCRAVAAHERLKNDDFDFSGWYHWPKDHGWQLLKTIRETEKKIMASWDCVVVIGIGGSFAGSKAVFEAMSHRYPLASPETSTQKPLFWAGHDLSEAALIELIDLLETRQPLIQFVSRSGTTTEPTIAMRVLNEYMQRRYGQDAAQRTFWVMGRETSALKLEEDGWHIGLPETIGGRFSMMTAAGMLPLAFCGYDVEAMMQGAENFYKDLEKDNPHDVLRYAAARMAIHHTGKNVELLVCADHKLNGVAEWWKQLFGESEGKDGKGIFPASATYSTDLHSLGQFVQEGNPLLFETFLKVEKETCRGANGVARTLTIPASSKSGEDLWAGRNLSEINKKVIEAAMDAHTSAGIPALGLEIEQVNERTLGELMAFFKVSCAVSALMLGVDPFNQPGVEAYKKRLFELMRNS
ncbi:MAG: glucose-6-phosphate isomerase [Oligoflexales bacterium]